MKKAFAIFATLVSLALVATGCGSTATTETVTVTQTVMAPAASNINTQTKTTAPAAAASAPVSFTGTGTTATAKFSLNQGLYRITLNHDGSRNFQVELMDSKGQTVEYLMNKIGVVSESKALRIDKTGEYLMNIEADGNWTITFQVE